MYKTRHFLYSRKDFSLHLLGMKLCNIIAFFCLLTTIAFGQNTVSDTPIDSVDQRFWDSSNQKIDSIQLSFGYQSDSLRLIYANKFSKIDSAKQVLKSRLDSIATFQFSSKSILPNGVDSVRAAWTGKLDSLGSSHHLQNITHKLDSLNNLREKTFSELNEKVQSLKDKTMGKLKGMNLPTELSDKASEVSSKIEGFQIPASDMNIPSLNIENGNSGNLGNLNIQSPVQDLGLKSEGALPNLTPEAGGLSDVTGKAGEYGKEVSELTKGNLSEVKELPATAEAKAVELSGLREVKDQTQVLEEYKGLSEKMQNPDSLKEFAVQEVKQVAVNHFAGKEQQLKEAMETISKYKAKYSSLNSIGEITKRPPNEMKGKPLVERIIPGIGIQVQKKGQNLLIDFNTYAGYRFTGRITAGLGWNQRVAYDVDRGKFNPGERIYGPRVFGEYKLWKGFSPRVEMESMNTRVPPLTRTPTFDPAKREWVWGAFVGLKKEYRFVKNVKGTALVMMRLFNPDHKSPYADVVNVRFGFEFPMKKNKKPKT